LEKINLTIIAFVKLFITYIIRERRNLRIQSNNESPIKCRNSCRSCIDVLKLNLTTSKHTSSTFTSYYSYCSRWSYSSYCSRWSYSSYCLRWSYSSYWWRLIYWTRWNLCYSLHRMQFLRKSLIILRKTPRYWLSC